MPKVRIIFVMAVIFMTFGLAPTASAVRTIPGNVPVLVPLQPAPENTKPNVSSNIENGIPQAPEQTENATVPQDQSVESTSPQVPLVIPQTSEKGYSAWLIFAAFAVLLGGAIGYWLHIKAKK